MDGKGQEGAYNFFPRRLGVSQGAGHREQRQLPPATQLAPPLASS